jgi:hypothetical protein
MQRVKEELQDIAKQLAEAVVLIHDPVQWEAITALASRIRNAGTLIPCDSRMADAKKEALAAYEQFTALVNDGVFE